MKNNQEPRMQTSRGASSLSDLDHRESGYLHVDRLLQQNRVFGGAFLQDPIKFSAVLPEESVVYAGKFHEKCKVRQTPRFRLGRAREWLAFGLLAVLVHGAMAAPAGGWRLAVPLKADFAPAAGPAAVTPANSSATFIQENAQAFLRLPDAGPGSQPAVLATWPAREILSTAQGAVRFRVRFRKLDAKDGKPVAILRLVNADRKSVV